jgi:hypothetical protein
MQAQVLVDAFVGPAGASGSRQRQSFGFLEGLDGQFAAYCGKSLQKVLQGFSALDIVEERLNRNARTPEDRRSVHDLGIDCQNTH